MKLLFSILNRWQFKVKPLVNGAVLCLFVLVLSGLAACKKNDYYPKPKAYPRLYFPAKGFATYQPTNCPFSFNYPSYANIIQDKKFFDEQVSCWFNVDLEPLNGKIHFSYKKIGADITLENVLIDSDELTYKHTKKADYIDESTIQNQHGVEGLLYEVGGNAASSMQFYLTDWKNHYIRGALYFESQPNIDSMRAVIDFVKADMLVLFDSFKWE